MANYLDELLGRIDDPSLRGDIVKEVARLRDTKDFGLVYERHLPETSRLPNHPVRRGRVVQRRSGQDGPFGVVLDVDADKAAVEWGDDDTEEVALHELVVVRRFGEPIHPGLASLGRIERGGDKPFHAVIKAENYHALQLLNYTHVGGVDVIYIDPPYNLGGDLTYNDSRVAKDDAYRHSKWLSFMARRLRQARSLLKSTGAIIVAIDDTEMAHLRMLMDKIFGESNFLAAVVWQGGRKNDSRYVSVGHDYMLIYARDESTLRVQEIRWREPKPGLERVQAAGQRIWEESGGDQEQARELMKTWFRQLDGDDPARKMSRYSFFNDDGTLARDDNITWPGGGGPKYDVPHPVTGRPVPVPDRGWIFSTLERMQEAIDDGQVIFKQDHTKPISLKRHLNQTSGQVALSVFERQRTHAGRVVKNILGEKRFSHPKDSTVLARWIKLASASRPDAVILDFFVGSGSTVQAVMELNAEDGGSRQCIAVTNNEVEAKQARRLRKDGHLPGDPEWEQWGLYDYVTRPRIETIATGTRPDGSGYSDGMDANVEFLELTYLEPNRVARGRAFAEIAPLLWLAAGGTGPRIDQEVDDYALPEGGTYGVLFRAGAVRPFVDALEDRDEIGLVYVVTDSTAQFQQVVGELPDHVEATMLYEDYLHNFTINTGGEQ